MNRRFKQKCTGVSELIRDQFERKTEVSNKDGNELEKEIIKLLYNSFVK